MIYTLIAIFIAGYLCIACEGRMKVNKAATALLMCGVMWLVLAVWGHDADIHHQMTDNLGDTCEILFYLIGAMAIVNLIDIHGGFSLLTRYITARRKICLLWLVSGVTFVLSALLDNMTTSIIMVLLLRRLVPTERERWVFTGVVILSANSGGAWSPIGDITTIMLWMKGNVSAVALIVRLLLPCVVAVVLPVLLVGRLLDRSPLPPAAPAEEMSTSSARMSRLMLFAGIAALLFVPVFKEITGLSLYMGMMISLGAMWLLTEIIYGRHSAWDEAVTHRVSKVLRNTDLPTILFFLGVLMSVAVLQDAGVLNRVAAFLDKELHEVFLISGTVGVLSAVVDNVPLVAAAMAMYPVAAADVVAAGADAAFAQCFVADGLFWHLLAYCVGVGGNLMVVGSAAGVVAMGLDHIGFGWYLKHLTLPALVGYLAGMGVIWVEHLLFAF